MAEVTRAVAFVNQTGDLSCGVAVKNWGEPGIFPPCNLTAASWMMAKDIAVLRRIKRLLSSSQTIGIHISFLNLSCHGVGKEDQLLSALPGGKPQLRELFQEALRLSALCPRKSLTLSFKAVHCTTGHNCLQRSETKSLGPQDMQKQETHRVLFPTDLPSISICSGF